MGGCHGAPEPKKLSPPVEGATLWSYEPFNAAPIGVRSAPQIAASLIEGELLEPGDRFWAIEEVVGEDGVRYLRLPTGGWLFDHKPEVGIMCVRCLPLRETIDEALDRARVRIGRAAVDSRYHRTPHRLQDDYHEQQRKVLGVGANGKVVLGVSRHTGEKVAIKHLAFDSASAQDRIALVNEVEILLSLDHPHVGRLLHVYEGEASLTLVFEYLGGGELFDRVNECSKFEEQAAAGTIEQILRALRYIHSEGVVHRDLKLENILYDSRSSSVVKVIDFGFAMFCRDGEGMMAQNAGTIGYLAPEVVSSATGTCGFSCDMWSVGVIAYVLLSGEMPFGSSSEKNVLKRIRTGAFSFPSERWGSISDIGLDFVRRCLSMRPQDRPSATDALRHPWLTFPKVPARCAEIAGAASPQGLLLGASTATSLSRFALMPVARLACLRLAAVSLMGSWLKPTRRDFLRLDETGSEYAFLEGLRSALESSLPEEEVMTICETLATSHENDVSSNVPGFKYSDFLVAADISEAADAGDHVFKDAFRRFDKESSDLVDGESVLKILHGDAEPEIEDVLDEACKPARTTGCYWVDRRWHAVLLLPFLFSLAATSNLTWPQ